MTVRVALALLAMSAALVAAPASAQDMISPYNVLAGKNSSGFSDRTARITSIMGPEFGRTQKLNVPSKPQWQRALRRDASAAADLR